jgi:hypothetical protein
VITEVGSAVRGFSVGDEVLGLSAGVSYFSDEAAILMIKQHSNACSQLLGRVRRISDYRCGQCASEAFPFDLGRSGCHPRGISYGLPGSQICFGFEGGRPCVDPRGRIGRWSVRDPTCALLQSVSFILHNERHFVPLIDS